MKISIPLVLSLLLISAFLFVFDFALIGFIIGVLAIILVLYALGEKTYNTAKIRGKILTDGFSEEFKGVKASDMGHGPPKMAMDVAHDTVKIVGDMWLKEKPEPEKPWIDTITEGSQRFIDKVKEMFS